MNAKKQKMPRILSVVGQSAYLYKQAPTIRLHGIWLGELGFRIGQKVLVEEEQGYLKISKIGEKQTEQKKPAVKKKKIRTNKYE